MGTRRGTKHDRRDGTRQRRTESDALLEFTEEGHDRPPGQSLPSDSPNLVVKLRSSSLLYVESEADASRADDPAGPVRRAHSYSRRPGRRRGGWRRWFGL